MKINLANLEEGLNEISFVHTCDSLYFTEPEKKEGIFCNKVNVKAKVNKLGSQYFLHIFVDTQASFNCNRCLETFDQPVKDKFRLVYSIETGYIADPETDEDFRLITQDTTAIDITADIKNSLLLMIPLKIVCSDNCRGLCPHCGKNLNIETCDCQSNQIDPRWEALKKIK